MCLALYLYAWSIFTQHESRVKQILRSQQKCSWYFSAIPEGALYLCIFNVTWLQLNEALGFQFNYVILHERRLKLMLASRCYQIRRQMWKLNNWGVPQKVYHIETPLQHWGKQKAPPKGSSIITCRHTSSWRLQQLQPRPRCPYCTNTEPSPCLQRATAGPGQASQAVSCKDCSSSFLRLFLSQRHQINLFAGVSAHSQEAAGKEGDVSTLPCQRSSFCKMLFCEAWFKSDPTSAKHILTSHSQCTNLTT